MTNTDRQRLAEIAAKVKKAKEAEELKEIEDYENLINGNKWKTFKWKSYVAALFAILMTLDILLPGKIVKMERYELVITDGYINVDGVWYTPEILEEGNAVGGFLPGSFKAEKSLIFGEVKNVLWTSEKWQYDRDAEPIYEERSAPSWNTIYYYFPGPTIAFLIPLMVVGFKRMSPWFKFFRYASWIIIFPSAIIFLLI